jgi:PKHD-type hydroxylase
MNKTHLKNSEGKQAITNQRYWLYESAISKAQCELIIKEADWNNKHSAEYMDSHDSKTNHDIRKTTVTFAPYYSSVGCIMTMHMMQINKTQWQYDIHAIQDIQIGHYVVGGHYDWHPDTMPPDENNIQRKLSSVLMLSDPKDYEGGELELKNVTPLKLTQGSIIVFPSPIEHRVLPVTKGERYSAVAWAVGPSFR